MAGPAGPQDPSSEDGKARRERPAAGEVPGKPPGGGEGQLSGAGQPPQHALAASLGSVDTLVEHPASMTHAVMLGELLEKMGIADGLVQLKWL